MMWIETLRLAWRSVRVNKVRSLLMMLGIIIGVMAVIVSSAVGTGAQVMVTKQVESLGSNIITVMPGAAFSGGISFGEGSASTLIYGDVSAITANDPDVSMASAVVNHNSQVVFRANNASAPLAGTDANYPEIRDIQMAEGRYFLPQEVSHNANVAVLGAAVAQTLFQGTGFSPLGQTININAIPFTVIGVAAPQGSSGVGSTDDDIAIPVTTEMNLFTGSQTVNNIVVSANSPAVMNQAQQELESTLRVQHQLTAGAPDDFRTMNQATILSALGNITGILTALLAGISAISLLVGGIGIMNIMLVSVTERTREIGIRKAIGAKRSVILSQFLMESMVLSLTGALIGLVIGGGGADIVGAMMHLGNIVSAASVLLAVIFSIAVGIVFGVYPARKASNLKPIDALRFE